MPCHLKAAVQHSRRHADHSHVSQAPGGRVLHAQQGEEVRVPHDGSRVQICLHPPEIFVTTADVIQQLGCAACRCNVAQQDAAGPGLAGWGSRQWAPQLRVVLPRVLKCCAC